MCTSGGAFQETRLPHMHVKSECQIREADEMGVLTTQFLVRCQCMEETYCLLSNKGSL